jgi:hypothetical protein
MKMKHIKTPQELNDASENLNISDVSNHVKISDNAVNFAEWIFYNAKVYPDGWHYKGDAYTTRELYKIFIQSTQ